MDTVAGSCSTEQVAVNEVDNWGGGGAGADGWAGSCRVPLTEWTNLALNSTNCFRVPPNVRHGSVLPTDRLKGTDFSLLYSINGQEVSRSKCVEEKCTKIVTLYYKAVHRLPQARNTDVLEQYGTYSYFF